MRKRRTPKPVTVMVAIRPAPASREQVAMWREFWRKLIGEFDILPGK